MNKRLAGVICTLGLSIIAPASSAWAGYLEHDVQNSVGILMENTKLEPPNCDCGVDPTCTYSSVYLMAQSGYQKSPPLPGAFINTATILISEYEICNSEAIVALDCYYPVDSGEESIVQVNANLSKGEASFEAFCFNYVSDTFEPLYVDVTSTGTGQTWRSDIHDHQTNPVCTSSTTLKGLRREGIVTGQISDGQTNFIEPGPNPSPDSLFKGMARIVSHCD